MRTAKNTARPRPDIGLRVMETMGAAPGAGLIGLRLMPVLMVNSIEGSYPVLPISALHNMPNDMRQSSGGYNRGDYEKEYGYYRTTDRGLEARIDHRDANFHGTQAEAEMITAQLKTMEMLRAHEKRVADKIMSTAAFPDSAAAKVWTDTTSLPRVDKKTAVDALNALGIEPNIMAMDKSVFNILQAHPDVQSYIYQLFGEQDKNGEISVAMLERYFGIPIAVAGISSQYNSKAPNEAAALSKIWDKTKVWIGRVRDDSNISSGAYNWANPHVGNTFVYNEGQSETEPFLAEDYPDDAVRSDIIRIRGDIVAAYTQSVQEDGTALSEVYKRCGYVLTGVQT